MMNDTICAVSTAPGTGGIAVIRVSGPDAIPITDRVFQPRKAGKTLSSQPAYTLHYGSIVDNDSVVDDVMVALFRTPHSFTGEDTTEITCHGSVFIQQQIMQLLVRKGARTALPGEFTQRAFLNGKMDLSQAEAVADLIASTSAGMRKLAINQMRGGFSRELAKLREQLLDFTSLIELELDFSEEDVEFADRANLRELAHTIEQAISRLVDSFSVGNAVKNGIPVAIVGETNAGKSTLLNLLVGEEKAIVSDIHGTTRDVIEDTINLSGITFRFIDTAGIRETNDQIESLGIERTFHKLSQASIVLWVIDSTSSTVQISQLGEQIAALATDKKLVLVFNKADLLTSDDRQRAEAILPDIHGERIFISAKNKENTEVLNELLIRLAGIPEISGQDIIVTNVRHYEALAKARDAIQRVIDGLHLNISGDFLSQDIRECIHYLGEITGGTIGTEEILGSIFSRFCIGK
ncbi:MAG: tRNA uridine-5-carboxymethylaminomethyl(34) synthesis GTPase MnmE [Tannerellaceae bacterium]|nr:tRNA uridine-5-carboxymethylaminomethyl(34) synthesis GTPase MnmE [Tannerellaceae bacterium]